jgi:hypothetical protein
MAGGTDEDTCHQVSHRTIWLYQLVVVASKLTIFLKEINVKLTLVLWSAQAAGPQQVCCAAGAAGAAAAAAAAAAVAAGAAGQKQHTC